MKKGKKLKFPKNFIWGTSTSAYQIEGNNHNDWSKWEKSEARIKELEEKGINSKDYICGKACDSYNRYEEDFDLAKKINNNAVRFGIEWSRIEPKEGKFNQKEIEHYRQVIEAAKKRDLKVVLTIWHWTNPIWLADIGGWSNKKAIKYYSRFIELIAKELGSEVDYWVTLNEPMMHVLGGYLNRKFPPNKKSIFKARKVFNNLVKAHKEGYKIIHKIYPNAKVSITALINYIEPARKWCLVEILIAKLAHYYWNDRFLKKIKKHLDYIGVDYYFHDRIIWRPPFVKNKNKEVTDMNWEIYPEGIYYVLKYLDKYKKPVLILENGIADKEDKYRADFIQNHLRYVHKAISEGVNVRGYFYWSLIGNFEWTEGFSSKFGLYKVDRRTFERQARPSSKVYAEICKNNSLIVSSESSSRDSAGAS